MGNGRGIIYSSFRAMFMAMFTVLGIIIGIVLFTMGIASLGSTPSEEAKTLYSHTIMPNGEGLRKTATAATPIILRLDINGPIGTEVLNRHTIDEQLTESREGFFKDKTIKALLIYINSPGGTVDDADGIYHRIKEYKEKYKIPVYAFVDGMCASGGMYIACAADKIYSTDTSLIGSVGVLFSPFLNFSELMKKVGVQSLTVYTGKGKDAMNPMRPWEPGEDKEFKVLTEFFYKMFVDKVVAARPMDREKLVNDFGAQVFDAVRSKEYGYIDQGDQTMSSTLTTLAKEAGIHDNDYVVVRLDTMHWFDQLLKGSFPFSNGVVTHRVQFGSEPAMEHTNPFLYMYKPGSF